MFDKDFDPLAHLQQLEERVAGMELILKKIINQTSQHSHHLVNLSEQGQLIGQALEGLHERITLTNHRITQAENGEASK